MGILEKKIHEAVEEVFHTKNDINGYYYYLFITYLNNDCIFNFFLH